MANVDVAARIDRDVYTYAMVFLFFRSLMFILYREKREIEIAGEVNVLTPSGERKCTLITNHTCVQPWTWFGREKTLRT